METHFNYNSVPADYTHCFNKQCDKNTNCMRRLVAEHCTSLHPTIRIVNPVCVPANGNACTLYHPIRKVRLAWGIKNLLNHIPHKDAEVMKKEIIGYFGRTPYYRLYRKEKGLTPEQQNAILQIFQNKGFTEEPAFEYFTEEYLWH